MADLLAQIHTDGYFSVVVGCHDNRVVLDLNESLDALREDYSTYAAGFGFAYYDLQALMQAHPEYYADAIHLNDRGHQAFAAAVAAIISGGIAERAKFAPQAIAMARLVAFIYSVIEGVYWNSNDGMQEAVLETWFGAPFKDFAGSIVVHAFAGWAALGAVLILGPRND